jgi:hypothetical protein
MMMAGPERATLQLGARWYNDDAELEALRAHLAGTLVPPDVPRLIVKPAAATDVEAILILCDDDQQETELARKPTSGAPPYSAVLSVKLEGDQVARVKRAIGGARDLLRVRYRANLPRPTEVRAVIAGDAAEDVAALMGTPTLEDAAARLEVALADGRLKLDPPDPSVPAALRDEAIAAVRANAAKLLWSIATGADLAANPAQLHAAFSLKTALPQPVELTGDVGEWFAGVDPAPHLIELPVNPW